jgi:NAD(P)-dependent dehydrogenase (short-subunit alcohol dehydrogenase family)
MMNTVVITGSAGGMGGAAVKLFQSKGFTVIGLDLKPTKNSDYSFVGDVYDEKVWEEITQCIESNKLEISSLINIAGRNYFDEIDVARLDQWRDMFDVNVLGMVMGIKHMSPLLKKARNATIVNMSSISAHIGSVGYAAYVATKGAVDSLTKSLALELAPEIRVNAVAPGWIETPFTVEGLNLAEDPVAYRKTVEGMHALKRVGTADEIASVIYFLTSEASSFVTGSILTADGGYLIKN